jgi:glycosyltransferase involved in cell wall biosynthesis
MSLMRTNMKTERADVPIVVVLYHREEDTRRMFNQLSRVTEGYSLIIVNNGFDDIEFIRKLGPLHYVENKENTGVIRGINQGLELAEGKYVAVLHNDILIYDDGWLDHIITFMERRPDVGLVGLGGWHSIKEDGTASDNVMEVDRKGWRDDQPVWRITEVAAVCGTGWVARNGSVRLDESFDQMLNACAVDMSLRYRDMGFKVHCVSVDMDSAWFVDDSGVEQDGQNMLADKWSGVLPVSRRCVDEKRSYEEISGLLQEKDRLVEVNDELMGRYRELLGELTEVNSELEEIAKQARNLEGSLQVDSAELSRLAGRMGRLESVTGFAGDSGDRENDGESRVHGGTGSPAGAMKKFVHHLRSEGLVSTAKKSLSYAKKRTTRK